MSDRPLEPRQAPTEAVVRPEHEPNRIAFQPIVMFAGGLILLTLVVLLIVGGMVRTWSTRRLQSDIAPPPVAATRQPPAKPHLQVQPGEELQRLRQAEEQLLSSYGWVDRAGAVVRLPIQRAMELLVERGLPAAPGDRP